MVVLHKLYRAFAKTFTSICPYPADPPVCNRTAGTQHRIPGTQRAERMLARSNVFKPVCQLTTKEFFKNHVPSCRFLIWHLKLFIESLKSCKICHFSQKVDILK